MEDLEPASRISLLLVRVSSGESGAFALLFAAAYTELCALARARLRSAGRLRQDRFAASALVHEAFLRLARRADLKAEHRAPFFKYAAKVMRSVLVDEARERAAQRRGGGAVDEALRAGEPSAPRHDEGLLRLHEALRRLSAYDPELAEIVLLRFFGGLTEAGVANMFGVTERTVRRRWERARKFLLTSLEEH